MLQLIHELNRPTSFTSDDEHTGSVRLALSTG